MPRFVVFGIFLLVVTLLFGGMHAYLWVRLVRDTGLPEGWRRALAVVIGLAALAVPAGIVLLRGMRQHTASSSIVAPALFGWMGVSFLLFAALLAADAVRLAAAAWSWASSALGGAPELPPDPARRAFVARATAGVAVAASGLGSTVAVRTALDPPLVREVGVRVPRLPRALSGLTIVQISDLHVGYTIDEHDVRRVVDIANRLKPDLVAITGDLVDGGVGELRAATAAIADLRARFGVHFVTGNHEYYSGVAEWVQELRRLGVRVLRNERVSIGDEGASLDLAGIEDLGASRRIRSAAADLATALAGRDEDRALVLLAHQPGTEAVHQAIARGVDLQLSGHTHGGQIFPWTYLVGAAFPYLNGLYDVSAGGREGRVYVSPGTGYWGPPMRLGVPAEVTKLVLSP